MKHEHAYMESNNNGDGNGLHVAVVVLGDIGRSPRMQYHALSLLENDFRVSLIGYVGEDLVPELSKFEGNEGRLSVIRFDPLDYTTNILPEKIMKTRAVYLLFRVWSLIYGLYVALWSKMLVTPDCLLVQNPPSIPLLLLSLIYCHTKTKHPRNGNFSADIFYRPGLVIDWHNLGFSMFSYSSDRHPIKQIAKIYEKITGPLADYHFTVTNSMRTWLLKSKFVCSDSKMREESNIQVLHDCPPSFFHPCTPKEIHNVMIKYKETFQKCSFFSSLIENQGEENGVDNENEVMIEEKTLFTYKTKKQGSSSDYDYIMRKDRPALVVSSTSWTHDEDFSILLDALVLLDQKWVSFSNDKKKHQSMVVAVTGKGPEKQYYEKIISNLSLRYISIHTLWLESCDYPLFIGSADLGISLHTSTSGIDLPMKILDMFGCEVPVCAKKFESIGELVVDGKNGRVFDTSEALMQVLFEILSESEETMNNNIILETYQKHIRQHKKQWRENWIENAKGLILKACYVKKKPSHLKFYFLVLLVCFVAIHIKITAV